MGVTNRYGYTLTGNRKGRYKDMTYKQFHDRLKWSLTEHQIAAIQEYAFQNYEDAHGRKPEKKEERQMAYGFTVDFLRDMNVTECVRCLKPVGIPLLTAIKLWDTLEES